MSTFGWLMYQNRHRGILATTATDWGDRPSVRFPAVDFKTFGGLRVTVGGVQIESLSPKQRLVLTVLLLDPGRVISVDRLVDLVWGGEAEIGVSTLHSHVSRLRSTLEPRRPRRQPSELLVTQSPGYRLAVDRAQVDLFHFEDIVAAGRLRLRQGDAGAALDLLTAALRLAAGALLPEFAAEPFVVGHAKRANEIRIGALEDLAEAHLQLGQHIEAANLLEREAAELMSRERLQSLLAVALYRADRQTDALRVIDRCRRALIKTSGLHLGPALQQLETSILEHDPTLTWIPRGTLGADVAANAERRQAGPSLGRTVLVGRVDELSALEQALSYAEQGRGTVATILGEPGIGKTRLAETLVDRAVERGFVTAWARCPEHRSAPPFWPVSRLAEQLETAGYGDLPFRDLGRLSGVGGVETFVLARRVLDSLAMIDRPVLFAIDDLQWADPDTLRLLEYVVSGLDATACALVATARRTDDLVEPAFVDCLAEIVRADRSIQVLPGGLAVNDIATWLTGNTYRGAIREIAELVHERTNGNPLFVKEVIELLAAEGRLESVESARDTRATPPGVKSVVRRRVSRLPPATQQILPIAAVLGRSVDLDALSAATSIAVADVLTALEPALATGLLLPVDDQLLFSHAIVAEALAEEVNSIRRASIHAASARAMAERNPDFGVQAGIVAHHAVEGILAGTGELAIDASIRAARLAADQFAHQDAAGHWARAAASLERVRPIDRSSRIDALLSQAEALVRADMVIAAKAPIIAAIDLATVGGLPEQVIRAALLLNHEHVWANEPYGVVDSRLIDTLERALVQVSDDDGRRPLLLAALASELAFADPERHKAVSAEAERSARAGGDPSTLATVLNAIIVPNRPSQLGTRRERATEVLDLASRHPLAKAHRFAAHYHLANTYLECAEFASAASEIRAARRVIEAASDDRLQAQLVGFESGLALARGQYAVADRLMTQAGDLHRRGRRYDVDAVDFVNLAAPAIDRGDLAALVPYAALTEEPHGYGRAVAEVMSFAMLELGRDDLAAALVQPFDATEEFPDDYTGLLCLTAALHVRVELGDRGAAASIAATLGAFPHRWAAAGTTPLSMGLTDLPLARNLALHGDVEDAAVAFDHAIRLSAAAGAEPWLARGLVHRANFLVDIGERARARTDIDEARRLAARHGLIYVDRRLDLLAV